jgi:hypothetical protein
VIHPALLLLIRKQLRGFLRRQFTGGSTKRTVFTILGIGAFILWLGSIGLSAAFQKGKAPEEISAFLPLYLTGFALLPIIFGNDDRAIAFTPAEIDFLFPGPFSRRDLVLYKMLKLVLSSIFGGVILSIWLKRFSSSFGTCIVAAAMYLVFLNLLTTAVALVRDTMQERAFTLLRRALTVLLIGGIAGIMYYVNSTGAPTVESMHRLADSIPGLIITAPARAFTHVFNPRSPAEFVIYTATCLAMIMGAAGLVLVFDKGYMEAALNASQRRQLRMARFTRGVSIPTDKPARPVSLPSLARLGPPGAIVKKQLITAIRASRGWIIAFIMAAAYGYFVSHLMGKTNHIQGANSPAAFAGLIPALAIMLMMLPQLLRFDFRSDLDHLDYLKSLPMSATAVAIAEIAVPSFILSLLGWLITGGIAAFMSLTPQTLAMTALAVPPIAILIMGLENLVFLLVPTRLYAPGQGAMTFSGRRVAMTIARFGLLVGGGSLITGAGFAAWALTHSLAGTYIACWLTLCLISLIIIKLIAWAFAKFDVSLDTPV